MGLHESLFQIADETLSSELFFVHRRTLLILHSSMSTSRPAVRSRELVAYVTCPPPLWRTTFAKCYDWVSALKRGPPHRVQKAQTRKICRHSQQLSILSALERGRLGESPRERDQGERRQCVVAASRTWGVRPEVWVSLPLSCHFAEK